MSVGFTDLAVMQVIDMTREEGGAGDLEPARQRGGGKSMLPLVKRVLRSSEQPLTIVELLR